jgi:hypothetical protein
LRINDEIVTEAEAYRNFELIAPLDILPTDSVEVVVSTSTGRQFGTLRWGKSGRPLPPAWRQGSHYRYPSFFLLGAAKSGTTSLHVWLDRHPEIFMSKPKEPYFFEMECELGADFYFSKYFGGWQGERVVGESRHRNLYLPYVPARVHNFNPEAKLLVVLRNPAERAVSHWWHWRSRGLEPLGPGESFEVDISRIQAGRSVSSPEEIAEYIAKLRPFGKGELRTYIDSGYYCEQLQRYLQLFRREQLHVILSDALEMHPAETTERVFEFLEVDSSHATRLDFDFRLVNRSKPGMWSQIDDSVWNRLLRHYEPHNRRLEQLLGCSLAHWDNAQRPVESGYGQVCA